MPCSMMPVLEIDGKMQIPQSMAIARYLAREFGKNYLGSNFQTRITDFVCRCVW